LFADETRLDYTFVMSTSSGSLTLGRAQGAERYFLLGKAVTGGDIVQLCASGGWITGRFECDSGTGGVPTFFFSVELDGGGVAQLQFPVPERALLRWP
jgi:hypothetical protein